MPSSPPKYLWTLPYEDILCDNIKIKICDALQQKDQWFKHTTVLNGLSYGMAQVFRLFCSGMTEPGLCEFYYRLHKVTIDWLLMFVNQTQVGADLRYPFCKRVIYFCPTICQNFKYRTGDITFNLYGRVWSFSVNSKTHGSRPFFFFFDNHKGHYEICLGGAICLNLNFGWNFP